jgi:hypothetical protein
MESMCLNIDALITKNTWMSLQNKNYGLCIEVDNDKNLIVSSIVKLYSERNCMKVFKAGRDNFSKYHSIDNFLFQFMKLIK